MSNYLRISTQTLLNLNKILSINKNTLNYNQNFQQKSLLINFFKDQNSPCIFMNIDNRYQNCLSDILSLLQEAVFRYVTDQQVDLSKFFQYFKQFYRCMVSLEESFHPNKKKFTKKINKIHSLSQQIQFNNGGKQGGHQINLQPNFGMNSNNFLGSGNSHLSTNTNRVKSSMSRNQSKNYQINQQYTKDLQSLNTIPEQTVFTNNQKNLYSDEQKTEELNVIGQIQERQDYDDLKFKLTNNHIHENRQRKRVGTAEGQRQKMMSVTIDFQRGSRPYTGKVRNTIQTKGSIDRFGNNSVDLKNHRYKSLTKYQKTLVNDDNSNLDQPQQSNKQTQKKIFNVGQKKTIYDFLEDQKKSSHLGVGMGQQILSNGLAKLPQKRKNKSFSRWSFKINKLL